MFDFPLPRLMLVTDSSVMRGGFGASIGHALRGAAQAETRILIQIREKEIAPNELLQLLQKANEIPHRNRALFMLNGVALQNALHENKTVARDILQLCDGVHWPESFLESDQCREYSHGILNGVSIHAAAAAERARTRGFDLAVFGPLYQTVTHPGTKRVLIATLQRVCTQTDLPIFAIGGIDATNAPRVIARGAYGIAVKSAVWNAENICEATRQLCEIVRDVSSTS